ncbi:LuxR C-terminal-related transcriptional regulator [Mycobacterium sp. ACS1612]|uniref:LuxR C-terminal-related transcriptional regulator n=1 Tax=Mycobacterium sp. ACS1612 TaxID=1834117 RepID=UPI00351676BF
MIANDSVLLREGLASLLDRSGFTVVGQAADGTELLTLVEELQPNAVIVDIRMAPSYSTEGLDAALAIRAKYPQTAIMLLSEHVDVSDATSRLLSEPSTGYLLKSEVSDVPTFLHALEMITQGSVVIDRTLIGMLMAARRVNDPLEMLSSREKQVLALVAEGLSNAAIARRLEVNNRTIEVYIRRVFRKLGLRTSDDDHRRVRAMLTYLQARNPLSGQCAQRLTTERLDP